MTPPDADAAFEQAGEHIRDLVDVHLRLEAERRTGKPLPLDEAYARRWHGAVTVAGAPATHDLMMVLAPEWVVDALLARLMECSEDGTTKVYPDASPAN